MMFLCLTLLNVISNSGLNLKKNKLFSFSFVVHILVLLVLHVYQFNKETLSFSPEQCVSIGGIIMITAVY